MLDRDLDPEIHSHIVNGADDFTGFADHFYDVGEARDRLLGFG